MITTTEELAQIVERALTVECVALDTEFVWEKTYHPRLGVIQMALSAEELYLLDVPALGAGISLLGKVLAAPQVVKILHDAQQDLTILRRVTGAAAVNVFDTRTAAGFADCPATLSLAALTQEMLGIELEKSATRSDWLRRPLSAEQTEYALDDVRYLHELREKILTRAGERGAWLAEEMRLYDDASLYAEKDPRVQFLRIKGRQRLKPEGVSFLREVAAWREEEACTRDCPRGRVLSDKGILGLAYAVAKNNGTEELPPVTDISANLMRRYQEIFFELRQKAVEADKVELPLNDAAGGSMPARVREIIDGLWEVVVTACEARGIDPGLIATRAELKALLATTEDPPSAASHRLLRGWRGDLVGEVVLQVLNRLNAVPSDG